MPRKTPVSSAEPPAAQRLHDARYHRDVLLALHDAQRRLRGRPEAAKRVAAQLRRENRELREHLAKLAALVDHYFAAWQETRLQLERRDRELADLRRIHRPQVIPLQRSPGNWS